MPVSNLFSVTQTLSSLLTLNVRRLFFAAGVPTNMTVSTMPPELVGNATERLNLYLHHTVQDPHFKNVSNLPGGDVAHKPLALSLYYILTAHHAINNQFDAQMQQQLMGLAMKTLHDFPIVDDELRISPDGSTNPTVMAPEITGEGNRFEILLRPITAEESTNFWSAEDSATARLSAFYEVRTIFLEPEVLSMGRGRVITVGLHVSPTSAPTLDYSRSTLSFSPPAATGLPAQSFEVSPAQPTLNVVSPMRSNQVRLGGSALAGDGTLGSAQVLLQHDRWRDLDPPVLSAPVDPALNPDWEVEFTGTVVTLRVQPVLTVDVGAGPVDLVVGPGQYSASVAVRKEVSIPGGTPRFSTVKSRQVPFSVGPHIDGIGPVDVVTGRFTIALAPTVDLTQPQTDIQLRVDGTVYEEVTAFVDSDDDAGLYVVSPDEIEFHPLFDGTDPGAHNIAVVVNGAQSQPYWIEVA